MTVAMLLRAAPGGFGDIGTQFLRERAIVRGTRTELLAVRNDFALQPRRAHALLFVRSSKTPAVLLAAAAGVGKTARKGRSMKRSIALLFVSALALSACNTKPGGNATEQKQGTGIGIDVAAMDTSV